MFFDISCELTKEQRNFQAAVLPVFTEVQNDFLRDCSDKIGPAIAEITMQHTMHQAFAICGGQVENCTIEVVKQIYLELSKDYPANVLKEFYQ